MFNCGTSSTVSRPGQQRNGSPRHPACPEPAQWQSARSINPLSDYAPNRKDILITLHRPPSAASPCTRSDGVPAVTLATAAQAVAPCATVQRFDVAPRLYFVLLVPDLEIQTARARRILPSKISRVAAVENCANACALTAAFASRDYEKMRGAFSDNLHQPFRAKLIHFLPRVIEAAERAGALGAFLSGSGSAIAAITLEAPKKIATAMARAAAVPAHTIITHADNRGAQVLPIRRRPSGIDH